MAQLKPIPEPSDSAGLHDHTAITSPLANEHAGYRRLLGLGSMRMGGRIMKQRSKHGETAHDQGHVILRNLTICSLSIVVHTHT